MMAFTNCSSPRGPMGWPVVSPIPWGEEGGSVAVADARWCSKPLRIRCGVVLHPTKHPKSHHSTQDRVSPRGGSSLQKRPSSAIIFALSMRRADDEKTLKVRQENLWLVKSIAIVDPCVQAPFESPEDVHLLDRRVQPIVSGCTR